MDLEAVFSDSISKKKVSKGAFHGSAGGFFTQKKKVIFGNVKHFGDKWNISLKSGSDNSAFSDVKSLSGDENDVDMSGGGNGSLLGSAVNTPRTNRLSTGMDFGSPLSSPNFVMDKEMPVKKFFALDINLSVVESKLVMAKTQLIRKIFSKINGFGGATTSLKFEEII
ncbi:hypothetical protein G9A89_012169 [Geosiphon pyriformis]|nr:hypothetical protein G9A89_012169 [Geosiphon pyriformis]